MTPYEQKLFNEATTGDATSAANIWKKIASGHASDELTLAWARHVAASVVEKVIENREDNANRRAEKALPAIGLAGRIDHLRDLKAAIEHHEHWNDDLEPGEPKTTDQDIADSVDDLYPILDNGEPDPNWKPKNYNARQVESIRRKKKKKQ